MSSCSEPAARYNSSNDNDLQHAAGTGRQSGCNSFYDSKLRPSTQVD